MSMKSFYEGSIKPLFTDEDRRDNQNIWLEEKVLGLFTNPRQWAKNLSTPAVQVVDNARIAQEQASLDDDSWYQGMEVSEEAFQRILEKKTFRQNESDDAVSYVNTFLPSPTRDVVGHIPGTNMPRYAHRTMSKKEQGEYFDALTARMREREPAYMSIERF